MPHRADLGQPRLREPDPRVPAVPADASTTSRPAPRRRRPSRRPRRRSAPSGFSHSTCLPASSAASVQGRCASLRQADVDRVDLGVGEQRRRTSRAPAPDRAPRARAGSRAAAACSTAPSAACTAGASAAARRSCRRRGSPSGRVVSRAGRPGGRRRAADAVAACMTAMLRRLPCGVTDIGAAGQQRVGQLAVERLRRRRRARPAPSEEPAASSSSSAAGASETAKRSSATRPIGERADDALLAPVADQPALGAEDVELGLARRGEVRVGELRLDAVREVQQHAGVVGVGDVVPDPLVRGGADPTRRAAATGRAPSPGSGCPSRRSHRR